MEVISTNSVNKYLYIIFAVVGFIFLKSGYGKVSEGKFVGSLAQTLEKFASKNPYPFVKSFLEETAIPNSVVYGYLTMYGEVFAGVSLLGVSIYLLFGLPGRKVVYFIFALGLLTGAFLNIVFYLSAGWTSPSTESLNIVMLAVQVAGLLFVWQKLRALEK